MVWVKNRNTYHLRDGSVNKKYSGGEGSCFDLNIARWRELRCNPSNNPLVYAGMVRGLMVLLLYPGGVAGMLLGTSRWLTRLLRHNYVGDTAVRAGAAAERAAAKNTEKYDELRSNYISTPLACEGTGVWNNEAKEFLNDLGSRISCSTGEARETSLLYQRLSISLQKGNAACINRPDPNFDWLEWCHLVLAFTKITLFNAPRNEVLGAKKNKK